MDTFLMSCRVMGREVEIAFLNEIEHMLVYSGITTLKSEYLATQKNSLVAEFWPQYGYQIAKSSDTGIVYVKKIPSNTISHAHLTILHDENFHS